MEAVLGVVLAIVLHLLNGGWWLDTGQRVIVTLVAVCAAAALIATTWRAATLFWAGVVVLGDRVRTVERRTRSRTGMLLCGGRLPGSCA